MPPLQGQSTYEIMELLPAGWAVAVSRSSGEPYYYNEASGGSTLDWPSSAYDAAELEVRLALGHAPAILGPSQDHDACWFGPRPPTTVR